MTGLLYRDERELRLHQGSVDEVDLELGMSSPRTWQVTRDYLRLAAFFSAASGISITDGRLRRATPDSAPLPLGRPSETLRVAPPLTLNATVLTAWRDRR